MARSRLSPELRVLLVLALGGCSAPPAPPAAPAAVDAIAHTWTIERHLLTTSTALTEDDATLYAGREVVITARTYQSPFHGTCEDAGRRTRDVLLADVALEQDLPATARREAARYGLGRSLVEYKLTCGAVETVPPLTMFVADARAMTCFAGVCYLLAW